MTRRVGQALAALAALVLGACAGAGASGRVPPPPAGRDEAAAREVLGRFARALEAGRFAEAETLLAARWRAAYGADRLALDFRGGGPAVREAAARVAARLSAGDPLERSGDRVRLAVGPGRAASAVLEPGGWRVEALE